MSDKIDKFLWNVQSYLMRCFGVDASERDLYPLKWYINTGRAPTPFLKKLLEAKPFMIARLLHKGGSVDEAVNRVKKYLGFDYDNY